MSTATEIFEGYETIELTQRFAVDGVELAWDRWGPDDGTAFVLGHGFSGSSQDFALEIALLARSRPVLSFDRRGHGFGTHAADAAGYTIDRLVADEIAFLEAHGGGPVDLLGHSMGGRVAVQVAIDRPDLLRSLILMDTSAWSFRSTDPEMAALLTAFFETYDPARGLPNMDAMRNAEDDLIAERVPAALVQRREAMFQRFDPVAMRELGWQLFGEVAPSMRPRLGEITCPVTVIAGSEDHPLVDQAPDLAAEVGNGTLTVIDGAYHSPQLTHPVEWLAAVEAHLGRAANR
jgi:2-succinyl-6-hydroxy-2,4-cyclohexadiene-1-carboxylate synthase